MSSSQISMRIAGRRIRAESQALLSAATLFPKIFFGRDIVARFTRAARQVLGGSGWRSFVEMGKPVLRTRSHHVDMVGIALLIPLEIKNAHLALSVIGKIDPRMQGAVGDNVFDREFLGFLGHWVVEEISSDDSLWKLEAWRKVAALPEVAEAVGEASYDGVSRIFASAGQPPSGSGQQPGKLELELLFKK